LKNELSNKESSPESVFQDVVQSAISNDHFRSRPWTLAMLDEMNLDKSYEFFKDRYSDASDFTFVFVGSFTVEDIKPFVKKYLGNLPSKNRKETWKESGNYPPPSSIERVVKKGVDPKSLVEIVYSRLSEWSFEDRFMLSALANILDIELRDKVREEAGGSYDISAASEMYHIPHGGYNVYIGFGCSPDQVEKLSSLVFASIDSIKAAGPLDANVAKVKEMLVRGLETNLKQNNYWMSEIQYRYLHGVDPAGILHYDQLISKITKESLRDTAKKYLDVNHKVRVILYPENYDGK
jgi:zinc protease